jgi:hypothetical protein
MSVSMRYSAGILVLSTVLVCGCGGATTATVKGKLIENGQAMKFDMNQAAVQLTLVSPEGKLDDSHSYTAVVNQDGSFEVIASGGQLPLGKYQVGLQIRGDNNEKYKKYAAPESPLRREIKGGSNHLDLDLAKLE